MLKVIGLGLRLKIASLIHLNQNLTLLIPLYQQLETGSKTSSIQASWNLVALYGTSLQFLQF